MITRIVVILLLSNIFFQLSIAQSVLIEAESFDDPGGWVIDPQFVEQMGSPYLMAHGMGTPVEDAHTKFQLQESGEYHIWVRSKNWAPGDWEAPGRFSLAINGQTLPETLGVTPGWSWEYAGKMKLKNGQTVIDLIDLTGFNGRCDAIFFSTNKESPPRDLLALEKWRLEKSNEASMPAESLSFDLVVVGGGIAGCASAIAAAEQGLKVALIHDRPVLGGNASSEIRVHTLGIYGHFERILKMLDTEHYPNGSPEAYKDEVKRHQNVEKYDNIHLFTNWRAYDANTEGNRITSVDARHTSEGKRIRFVAPRFVDSTGDGWIGYWAGADFMYGRESVDTYGEAYEEWGELWSPEESDDFVMGSSVLWRTQKSEKEVSFPEVPWAEEVAQSHQATEGTWKWELSRLDLHQIEDAEEIRDHMLKAIYGSFANAKNEPGGENLKFEWISYLVGKRESRRLEGDYIFTFNDVTEQRKFPDSVVMETREVDVHFQQNLTDEDKPDFLSEAIFFKTPQYYIPYRSLYSKNIENLFMAGRNFSCSHIGLGGPRVMRTTGQMGAAVGIAAVICEKYGIDPREVYTDHLEEYMALIEAQKTYRTIPEKK
ncbi:FAD-dependent oxidoreductase [uncultured Algoriphagus sp.]|uniref:FAD-dependent oxidoreductase n=1 Tax=uncultured Algoriphagus sp. TaxID=417365 RepID=UPI0030ECA78B|tara:strand:+ start:102451 stop:104247 length:1797 start_codon:yes stop_codon:yes gene_type:complete